MIHPIRPMAVLFVAFALSAPAYAAHPLATEDTGTQGAGNVEIENGWTQVRASGSRASTYQPQLSYGLMPSVDLIVQPSWTTSRDASARTVRGAGDTNLDIKWRFFDAAFWSLGVRAGVTLATNQHGQGLPGGDLASHALLVATYKEAPLTLHSNLGWSQNASGDGQRSWGTHASSALMWSASKTMVLMTELGADANQDPDHRASTSTWLTGLIHTVRPGLDLDIGYRMQLRSFDRARTLLLGLTYRFAV